ncbi:hypothetical protein NPX13_g3663 [Xylaria arbuscula]|uniref:Microbial-type PARG catalytic domain-containing protein n=1 Tax=Xylaria arbuscula TaxID=114810 RepID=A0A9W8NHU5_9PEZI|nr:hypothetical protein NPX13_g3663 [Xylaria arbuscula]
MRTTLLPALRDEYYRLPELGIVYTPDVLVFQSASDKGIEAGVVPVVGGGDGEEHHDEKDILSKNDRWYVDVASAAMLRLPETEITENGGRYASPADRELVVRKMRAVLRVFAAKGCTHIVLGAWGCGAYGNPLAEIAKAWRRVLCVEAERGGGDKAEGRPNVQDAQRADHGNANSKRKKAEDKKSRKRNHYPEPWGAFIDDIVFAIKDSNLAIAFARAFGEDILPLPASFPGGGDNGSLSSTTGDDEYPDNPVEVARISELQEKIVQLEAQIRQTRNPQMQVGLESVLASLKKQLPTEGVEEDNHEVNDDDEGSEATEQESSSEHGETTD